MAWFSKSLCGEVAESLQGEQMSGQEGYFCPSSIGRWGKGVWNRQGKSGHPAAVSVSGGSQMGKEQGSSDSGHFTEVQGR